MYTHSLYLHLASSMTCLPQGWFLAHRPSLVPRSTEVTGSAPQRSTCPHTSCASCHTSRCRVSCHGECGLRSPAWNWLAHSCRRPASLPVLAGQESCEVLSPPSPQAWKFSWTSGWVLAHGAGYPVDEMAAGWLAVFTVGKVSAAAPGICERSSRSEVLPVVRGRER